MAMVLPLRTAWIADILSQASLLLRDVERQRYASCWKRGSGDFGTTVNPEYFVCMLFSYIPYAAASVRK